MKGIVTVLNTPFAADGSVDPAALARHTQVALDAGVAGFLVPALAAEVQKLTPAERDTMVRTVVATVRGRVPVIGGASAPTQDERCRHAGRLAELGCDIVLVNQPFESQDQYVSDIAGLAKAAGRPVMIQDWDASGPGVPLQAILAAFEAVDAFRYLKVETANAGHKYTALKQATGGKAHVSGGWAVMQLIEALDRGVDAFMPTAFNIVYVAILKRYAAGDRDGAVALFRRLLPVLAFSNQSLETSILFFKRLLWRQGIYPTPDLRAPAGSLDDYQLRVADELIALVIALEAELAA
ncbi:MAG: dihydrodipicolinate synthase family protein [Proteobacteria bacterium]|nr:dihydrodipicolinate synthase family protein [Pseudomonadota bacterium]